MDDVASACIIMLLYVLLIIAVFVMLREYDASPVSNIHVIPHYSERHFPDIN